MSIPCHFFANIALKVKVEICRHKLMPLEPFFVIHGLSTSIVFLLSLIGIKCTNKVFSSKVDKTSFTFGLLFSCLSQSCYLLYGIHTSLTIVIQFLQLVLNAGSLLCLYFIYKSRFNAFDGLTKGPIAIMVLMVLVQVVHDLLAILHPEFLSYQELSLVILICFSELFLYYKLVIRLDYFLSQKPKLLKFLYTQLCLTTLLYMLFLMSNVLLLLFTSTSAIQLMHPFRLLSVAHFYYLIIVDMRNNNKPVAIISNTTKVNNDTRSLSGTLY